MTFVITQPCIDTTDQSCVDVCPVDCIHFEEDTDRMLYIDPVECIDCGACEPVCPVDAIFTEDTVPEDQAPFYDINVLWYQDPAAARAKMDEFLGGAPAAAPAAGAAPAAEEATEPASVPAAEAEAPADAPAAEEVAEEAPVAQGATQVAAVPPTAAAHEGVVVPHYSLPSPRGLVATTGLAVTLFFAIVFPGPIAITVAGVSVLGHQIAIGITVLLVAPLVAVFSLMFIKSQAAELAGFAARGERIVGDWRQVTADWRRSEESRRYEIERTVREIADTRYRFPDGAQPDLRTYVNLPQPLMALEFYGAGGEKVFPDIVVTRYPGNYPVMVAQVETSETLSRDQAKYVWARLENEQAPLDLYVPAGLAARAKDYARAAGIKHLRLRTWRRQPHGLTIREL